MKMRCFLLVVISIIVMSCGNDNNLKSWVVSDITEFSHCNSNKEFKEWLFSINSDGKIIKQDDVVYKVNNIYDPETGVPGVMIEIVNGVAEYYRNEFLDELISQMKDDLKNQSSIHSIYSEYDWLIISLKNEHEFNNGPAD